MESPLYPKGKPSGYKGPYAKDRCHPFRSNTVAIVRLKRPWEDLSRYRPLFTMFYSHHPQQRDFDHSIFRPYAVTRSCGDSLPHNFGRKPGHALLRDDVEAHGLPLAIVSMWVRDCPKIKYLIPLRGLWGEWYSSIPRGTLQEQG